MRDFVEWINDMFWGVVDLVCDLWMIIGTGIVIIVFQLAMMPYYINASEPEPVTVEPASEVAVAPTPNCVSHQELKQLHLARKKPKVHDITDTTGQLIRWETRDWILYELRIYRRCAGEWLEIEYRNGVAVVKLEERRFGILYSTK